MPILDNFRTGATNLKEKINSSVEAKVARKVTQSKNEIGILDPRFSPHRKCWLSDGKKTIVGVYGRGTSQEITEVWNSPYQNASLESATPQATAAYQIFTGGKTFVKDMNSARTWSGNEPTNVTLELMLYAVKDAAAEVMLPLRTLEEFAAPDTSAFIGLSGKATSILSLDIGRRIIYPSLCMTNISMPFDKEVDSKGNFVRCTVNITFTTPVALSQNLLKQGYGIKITQ